MNVLIASVHTATQRSKTWIDLQKKFISETTADYRFAIYCNGVSPDNFENTEIIGYNKSLPKLSQHEHGKASPQSFHHCHGLNEILSFFRSNKADHYLILDSDGFPTEKGWLSKLKKRAINYEFAAPIRTENLDCFPHPCALFIKSTEALQKIDFHVSTSKSLSGNSVEDVMPNLQLPCYPLVRTNKVNLHPIFAAMYGNLFYHHGCGSRFAGTRATSFGAYEEMDHTKIEEWIYKSLKRDPEALIDKLNQLPKFQPSIL